jgi:hypothetical protein
LKQSKEYRTSGWWARQPEGDSKSARYASVFSKTQTANVLVPSGTPTSSRLITLGFKSHSQVAIDQLVAFHLRSHLQRCGQRGYRQQEFWFMNVSGR